jgi:prepilin-type N-terminal cleavage/methylation domain-containing protein
MKTHSKKGFGFTLIELLVVVAIISMLVGLLSVGLRKTKIISSNLRQKSVFHAMEIGLAMFSKDFDGYPESGVLPNRTSANQVCGAQHLLEALIGRDEEGVEPRTNWYAPDATLFMPPSPSNPLTIADYGYYDIANPRSKDRRKGPYGEFKHIEVHTVYDLWQGQNGSSFIYDSQGAAAPSRQAPLFTDVFRKYKIALPGGGTARVGTPILYFKANRSPARQFRLDNTARLEVSNPGPEDMKSWTYNFQDNQPVVDLPSLADTSISDAGHYVDPKDSSKRKPQVFYEQITLRSDPSRPFFKPFNADTFLLISAGWDGIYGNEDDVTNFEY